MIIMISVINDYFLFKKNSFHFFDLFITDIEIMYIFKIYFSKNFFQDEKITDLFYVFMTNIHVHTSYILYVKA